MQLELKWNTDYVQSFITDETEKAAQWWQVTVSGTWDKCSMLPSPPPATTLPSSVLLYFLLTATPSDISALHVKLQWKLFSLLKTPEKRYWLTYNNCMNTACKTDKYLCLLEDFQQCIIIIIIIPRQRLRCCHHGRAIARVHPVHLINVEQRQVAADPRPTRRLRLWVCLYRLPESTPTNGHHHH